MLVAGEPSGDQLAAELVIALRQAAPGFGVEPRFFAAGGPHLEAAGAEITWISPGIRSSDFGK